jgi:hypothetical protein
MRIDFTAANRCELRGTGTSGRVKRESATARTYYQAGEFDVAFFAGGSGAGHGAQRAGMAEPVFPSGDAAGTEDRQGCYGTPVGSSPVLDVAQAMGL